VNAEFLRVTTIPLEAKFMEKLDERCSELMQVVRKKGGAIREKTKLLPIVEKVYMFFTLMFTIMSSQVVNTFSIYIIFSSGHGLGTVLAGGVIYLALSSCFSCLKG